VINGQVEEYTLLPQDFGLECYPVDAIAGGDPDQNRQITTALLQGKGTPAQQAAIAMNVAALLKLAGKVRDYRDGAKMALEEMASGRPYQLALKLAEESQC